jgi:hypothetical protein
VCFGFKLNDLHYSALFVYFESLPIVSSYCLRAQEAMGLDTHEDSDGEMGVVIKEQAAGHKKMRIGSESASSKGRVHYLHVMRFSELLYF